MGRALRFFGFIVALTTALYLVARLLLWLSSEGLFSQLTYRNQFVATVLLFLMWLAVFGSLQVAKPTEKRFWYFLEHPLYSFSAKIILVLILAAGAGFLLLEINGTVSGKAEEAKNSYRDVLSPLAILFTGVLATVGWNYTSFETRRAEVRKFTVDAINKIVDDSTHQRLYAEFLIETRVGDQTGLFERYQKLHHSHCYRDCIAYFAKGDSPTPPVPSEFGEQRRVYAIGRYLDQLEWLALLVRQRRIDEQLTREMLEGTLETATATAQTFIREARTSAPATYEHVVWLYEHWTGQPSNLHPNPRPSEPSAAQPDATAEALAP